MNNKIEELLKDRLKKELLDVIEYNELYEALRSDNKYKYIAEHLANDELEHAKVVQYMIDDYEIELSDEYKELWDKALKCFN